MKSVTFKKLENEKLYTKHECNIVFSIKEGSDTCGLIEVSHDDIFSVLRNEKNLEWVSYTKDWYLENDGFGYTDSRIDMQIVQRG